MDKKPFKSFLEDALLALPQDMKSFLRIVEDPNLEDPQKVLAAGAVMHVLAAHNAIPGLRGILAYVDDVIVMRLVLERLVRDAPAVMQRHREHEPELFDPLEEHMEIIRAYLGDLLVVLDRAVDALPELSYEGYTAPQCALEPESASWLYGAVQVALVDELELDEDEVVRALRKIDQIRRPLEMRLAT